MERSRLLSGEEVVDEIEDNVDVGVFGGFTVDPFSGLARARVFYLSWIFVKNVSFGIISSSYFSLFKFELDDGRSLLPTLTMPLYSVTSVLIT